MSLAILLTVLVTTAGLHVILQGTLWWLQLALLSIVVLGAAAIARSLTSHLVIPPLVALLVLIGIISAVFAPSTSFLFVVPTFGSVNRFQQLLDAANTSIAEQSLPATVDSPIMLLLCIGVGGILLVMDALALGFRAPALAGAPLLILLAVPSIVSIDSTDPLVFVLAALAYLLLLRAASTRRQTGVSFTIAAVVVVGSLVAPVLLPSVTPAAQDGTGFSTGVNPVLTLGSDLRQGIDHTVLDYSTESGLAQYLGLVTIEDFTGSNWGPSATSLDRSKTVNNLSDPVGLSNAVLTSEDQTRVKVQTLTTPWLPLPYPASSISGLTGDWFYDPASLSVRSPSESSEGQSYSVTSLQLQPTPAQLAGAGTSVPAGFDKYLQLPPSIPTVITATATAVAGGASNNYEKALLLQSFFREGDFTYSETAPVEKGYDGTGMDVIASFLRAKEGYCIHFASAMAVMARSLGIPSRITVGFLPGELTGTTSSGQREFRVTSHDLHAWPELYFEGIGWTRFEPTVGRGDVPAYADPTSTDVPTPSNTPDAQPSTSASAAPSATRKAPTDATGPASDTSSNAGVVVGSWLWIVLVIVAVLLVLLIPAIIRSIQRARRLRSISARGAPVLVAWREVVQASADLGVPIPPTTTPRDAMALLGAGTLVDEGALARLVAAVERESFSSDGSLPAYQGAVADTRSVLDRMRSSATRAERFRAALAPASTWSWATGWTRR